MCPLPFNDDHARRQRAAQLLFGLPQVRTEVAARHHCRVGEGGMEELRDELFRVADRKQCGLLGEFQHHRLGMLGQRQQRLWRDLR